MILPLIIHRNNMTVIQEINLFFIYRLLAAISYYSVVLRSFANKHHVVSVTKGSVIRVKDNSTILWIKGKKAPKNIL